MATTERSRRDELSPSMAVVDAVAEAEGIEPTELEPPLWTVIDTDALDRLFATSHEQTGRVVFRYGGYDISVSNDGSIDVQEHVCSGTIDQLY